MALSYRSYGTDNFIVTVLCILQHPSLSSWSCHPERHGMGMLLSGGVRIWAFKLRSKRFCRLLQGMENLGSWQMLCWLGIGNVAHCFWRSSVQCQGCGASYGRLSPCRQNCAANDWRRISINSLISSTLLAGSVRHPHHSRLFHRQPRILDWHPWNRHRYR